MQLGLWELRRRSQQFVRDENHWAAIRAFCVVLYHWPEDFETRLALADSLGAVGADDQAARVSMVTADLCIDAGHPLFALLAIQQLQAGRARMDHLLARLSRLYGRGSRRLGSATAGQIQRPFQSLRTAVDHRLVAGAFRSQCHSLEGARKRAQLIKEAVAVGANHRGLSANPLRLGAIPLLSELSPAALCAVVRAATIQRFSAGQVIVPKYDAGSSCYLLARGEAKISSSEATGTRKMSARGAGSIFGEKALIFGMQRVSSVVATTDSDVIQIGPDALASAGLELPKMLRYLSHLARDRWAASLANNPVFRFLNKGARRKLLQRFDAFNMPQGTVVVAQGQQAKGLFVVVGGHVASVLRSSDGKSRVLGQGGAGAMPGLGSILGDRPARSSAVITSPVATLLFLPKDQFHRLADTVPEVALSFEAAAHDCSP